MTLCASHCRLRDEILRQEALKQGAVEEDEEDHRDLSYEEEATPSYSPLQKQVRPHSTLHYALVSRNFRFRFQPPPLPASPPPEDDDEDDDEDDVTQDDSDITDNEQRAEEEFTFNNDVIMESPPPALETQEAVGAGDASTPASDLDPQILVVRLKEVSWSLSFKWQLYPHVL